MGETATLPHTLDIAFHYEYLRSRNMYEGGSKTDDPEQTKTVWHRATLAISYGISSRFSATAIMPYVSKEKSRFIPAVDRTVTKKSEGIGDFIALIRYTVLPRSFVDFRELSIGLGLKIPTGDDERECAGATLPRELQPGTGSWDFTGTASFYAGYEIVDFFLSTSYQLTTKHDSYKFGNQLSFLILSSYHVHDRLDLSAGFTGAIINQDRYNDENITSTGRTQIWFTPGLQFKVMPEVLRLQFTFEQPVYQHFNEKQLGSDYNLRATIAYSVPLSSSDED